MLWRAVDFLMMECSLKFLVAPHNARLDDLLRMEQAIDSEPSRSRRGAAPLARCMLRSELEVVTEAVRSVRACAVDTRAVSTMRAYRAGLALMPAGHTTMPGLNQLYLLHSLAFYARQLA